MALMHRSAASHTRPPAHHRQQRLRPPQAAGQVTTTSTTTAQQQAPARRKLQRQDRLRDPAKIGSRGSASVMVNDVGGPVSLATYMQLPVEQYYILDPSQIQLLSGNTFILSVPKVNLLGASLQPVITVEVTSERDAVILQATDCQLNATGIMGGLDERFAMQFTTRLTWSSPQHQHLQFPPQAQEEQRRRELDLLAAEQQQLRAQQQHGQPSGQAPPAAGTTGSIRSGWQRLRAATWPGAATTSNSSNSSSSTAGQAGPKSQQGGSSAGAAGSITSSSVVDVWCEVIPPFNLMPREVLVGTCNTVISSLINSLLPWFTRQLAADYQKWARDPAYRASRAARSMPRQDNGSGSNN